MWRGFVSAKDRFLASPRRKLLWPSNIASRYRAGIWYRAWHFNFNNWLQFLQFSLETDCLFLTVSPHVEKVGLSFRDRLQIIYRYRYRTVCMGSKHGTPMTRTSAALNKFLHHCFLLNDHKLQSRTADRKDRRQQPQTANFRYQVGLQSANNVLCYSLPSLISTD
jgi:hypothetical protein